MKSKAAYHWPWIWCAWSFLVMPCIALAFPGAASGLVIFSGIWLIVCITLLGTDTVLDSGFGFFLGVAIILFGLFAGPAGEASIMSILTSILPEATVKLIEENVLLTVLFAMLFTAVLGVVFVFFAVLGMALHKNRKDWRDDAMKGDDAAKDDRSPECL